MQASNSFILIHDYFVLNKRGNIKILTGHEILLYGFIFNSLYTSFIKLKHLPNLS